MRHLSEIELLDLLYGDGDSEGHRIPRQHVESCSECQAELARLRAVAACLDRDRVPLQDAAETVSMARRTPRGGRLARHSSRGSGVGYVLAASLALLLGAGAFLAGTVWQARNSAARFEHRLDSQIAALDASFSQRLTQIAASLTDLQTDQGSVQADRRIEAMLIRLAENQASLRKELQALALSAESELTLAKQKIDDLNQFALAVRGQIQ